MELGTERNRSDVVATAQAAGLSISEGANGVQLLKFADQLNYDELKLMELPQEVLLALRSGERVVVRGEPGEDAVLCTNELTYDLRAADTSNALLLVPSLSYSQQEDDNTTDQTQDILPTKEVTVCLSSYYELRSCQPKTGKLRQLLAESPYRGPEYEIEGSEDIGRELEVDGERMEGWNGEKEAKRRKIDKNQPRKYTFSDLLSVVQASETQLWDALDKLHACLIAGYWRVLEADYAEQAMQFILTLLEEQDWHWTQVPLTSTCHHLQELLPRSECHVEPHT